MDDFLNAALGYPTVIYTAGLGFVLFYWLLALVGVVDFENDGIDLDLDSGLDHLGGLASAIVAFGLNGVPFSVVLSVLVLVSWTLCCTASVVLLPLVPTAFLQLLIGTVVLLVSFGISLPVTARVLRPMRRLFVSHTALSNASLVGQHCKVLTDSVDTEVGRAEVAQRGSSINIRVWAHTPNTLRRHANALILEYDAASARYLIAAAPQD